MKKEITARDFYDAIRHLTFYSDKEPKNKLWFRIKDLKKELDKLEFNN